MHILHIETDKNANLVDKHILKGDNVFVLVYMVGCGPCNATRPEWAKLKSALETQYSHNDQLVVIDINKDYLSDIKHIGPIEGFPTMKYISNFGKNIETYENSSIKKINKTLSTVSVKNVYKRISKRKTKTNTRHKKKPKKTRRRYYKKINK